MASEVFDVAVIGAGFGGLGAALRLAERGASVVLLETLAYPGGCASTFTRDGYRFESGATLFSGFAPGQLFAGWIERHDLPVEIDWIDPLVELRSPDVCLATPRDRSRFVETLAAWPGAPRAAIERFFARQAQVAAVLWELLDEPALLPPLDLAAAVRHLVRLPRTLPLLPLLGRPLGALLRAEGLDRFRPLVTWADALCQITVQCPAAEAEAIFALGTMDYYWRGTGHVRGGIGSLATALAGAVARLGGEVRLASRVRSLARRGDEWQLEARGGSVRARQVVANLLPQDLHRLLAGGAARASRASGSGASGAGSDASGAGSSGVAAGAPAAIPGPLGRLARRLDEGWGACMLYLAIGGDGAAAFPSAHHLEIVQDPRLPLVEGNHLFCSVSGPADTGRAPAGQRTVTVSTHVAMAKLRALAPAARGELVAQVHERMRRGIRQWVPEWSGAIAHELTASPRTFERFTGRSEGLVGGIPRRAGMHHYWQALPPRIAPGLHLVGDTMFPGQSTLAAALGGHRVAEAILAGLEPASLSGQRRALAREPGLAAPVARPDPA